MFFINSNDGVKISVCEWNKHCKQTILLVHGWPLSHKIYEYQIGRMVEKNYRVVAMDLRGFGKSDSPACGYSYNQMAYDIYNVIRALRLNKFILVGFSMGGAIALRYMKNFHSYGVKKLFLLSAAAPKWTQGPCYPYGLTKEYVNSLIHLASTDRPKMAENFSQQLFASCQSKASIDWFRQIALSASAIGTIKSAISLRDEDVTDSLKCVSVPTIIIHGDKDEVVSNDLVELQHKEIKHSKLYTLEHSGHGIMYDQLEEFNCIFFKEIEKCFNNK